MFTAFLYFHIFAAVLMAGIAFGAMRNIVRAKRTGLPRDARRLSILMLAQAASGSLLGLLAPELSVADFCLNFGLYTGAFIAVQFFIFVALKKTPELAFPHLYARVSTALSVASFAFVILARAPIF